MSPAVRLGDEAFLVRLRGGVFSFRRGDAPRRHRASGASQVDLGVPERIGRHFWQVRRQRRDTGALAPVYFLA